MRRMVCSVATAGVLAVGLAACGGGGGPEGSTSTAYKPIQTHGTTDCGQSGLKVELHSSSCQMVETMVNLLNGRAKRSVLTVRDESGKVRWVCVKPSHSLYAPLRCTSGKHSFAATFTSH